jgi:hypothetical protein
MEQLVGRLSFRVQQLDVRVETKTSDNVFLSEFVGLFATPMALLVVDVAFISCFWSMEMLTKFVLRVSISTTAAVVSVQYQVLRENVFEAFYALTNPAQQITSHVFDTMRAQLPTLELDAVFEAKEELALAVKQALTDTFTSYGYQILQTLITDLDPDQRVKNAMNEINSSKRLKYAVAERAEGDKILQVKSAEAEAEAKYLSGVGVAKQRKAIVDGLRESIVEFSEHIEGSSTKEVMDLLLLTQYFDMIRDVGSASHCRTTFVPTSRTLGDELRGSLLQADAVTKSK